MVSSCISVPETPELRPTLDMDSAAFESSALPPATVEWWTQFSDPALSTLIEDAVGGNRTIAQAHVNILRSERLLDLQRRDLNLSTLSTADATLGRGTGSSAETEVTGRAGLSASWEYDAFDRIDALIAAAEANVEIAREDRRDLAAIIAGSTADAYADLRGAQVRYGVAARNAALQAESLDLLRTLFENGRATRLDLERAESQYQTTLASLPLLAAQEQTALLRLAALTGRTSTADLQFYAGVETATIPMLSGALLTGSPEDLIRRRPDIRRAEARLEQTLALGQVARAELFPRLTFNASVNALFDEDIDLSDSFGFGIGPALQWSGPDLSRVYLNIDIADADAATAVLAYEETVISALSEINIALTDYTFELSRRENLEQAARSADRALELARIRFEEGLDDYLDVIDAQRTLLDSEDRLESSRLAATKSAIAAYRALGGVWSDAQLDDVVYKTSLETP